MKIISKWTDYYDYVASMYGGGDPKIIYDRRVFDQEQSFLYLEKPHRFDPETHQSPRRYRYFFHEDWAVKFCSVNAKLYVLARDTTRDTNTYEVVLDPAHPSFIQNHQVASRQRRWYSFTNDNEQIKKLTSPKYDEYFLKISREINRPAFVFADGNNVEMRHPNLGELGFGKYITPEQMYQDISYFVGNLLHLSPDLAPPVQLSDKDRLAQHGFDPKRGFRH